MRAAALRARRRNARGERAGTPSSMAWRDGTHLACDGQAVGAVDALDDAPDVLDGGHERRELVLLEVGEAGDDTGGYYEDICGGREAVRSSLRPGSSRRTDGLGRWA